MKRTGRQAENPAHFTGFKAATEQTTAAFIRWQLLATFPEWCCRVQAPSSRPLMARRNTATQAASWWAVDEVRGHCGAKWDLTLDKQARPRATMAYGCEGGEEAEEGWRGWGGSQAVHSASHETPSCHNRHLPALTLNTHRGKGGSILPPSNRRIENRKDGGKREGNLFFLLLWCLRNAGICPLPLPPPSPPCLCPLPLLKPGCKPTNYSC